MCSTTAPLAEMRTLGSMLTRAVCTSVHPQLMYLPILLSWLLFKLSIASLTPSPQPCPSSLSSSTQYGGYQYPLQLRGSDTKVFAQTHSAYYVPSLGFLQIGYAELSYSPIPAANLQSPYAQVPCIPLCPRLDKKAVRRKQASHNHSVLDQCVPASLGPDLHGLFFQPGQQGSRWVRRARTSRAHLLC